MDFFKEVMERREKHLSAMGEMSYKRFQLGRDVELMQKQIAELDSQIAVAESLVGELAQTERDFNTYMAVKEGAVTLTAVGQGIVDGGAVPPPQLGMSSRAARRTARNGRERAPAMLCDANLRVPEVTRATVSHPRPAVRYPPVRGGRSALHGEPAMNPR